MNRPDVNRPNMRTDVCDPQRRSIRLKGYDYSQTGAYFVTICTQDRVCLFGEVVDGDMQLNVCGLMAQTVWDEMPDFYLGVDVDAFVVMPNHIHGIIVLVGAAPRGRPASQQQNSGQQQDLGQPRGVAPTVGDVVHRFKTMTTKRYADGVKQSGWVPFRGRLWQRNYYEHVIRDDRSLDRIRRYILDNPLRWDFDRENPFASKPEPEMAWRD